MRPCTASSCCCQVQSVSWAPVPTPNAAARPVICHGPLYRLPMLLPRPDCVMGPCTASHCCCQACNLPWAPHTDSSCCCQARNLPWAPVPPPHADARSRVCHGSLYGLPLLLSLSPHSAMCHFQVSSHCWWFPFLS
ncbi:unnamed protein product [Staurois parvus]|uniref:Uncharacterized protein n=1 Tax=Staurois parvus TaxID=386267 RepID=A0ABN9FDX5_9NEOB|nr:unnamed protein product [Staurois parvus]